MSYHFNQPSGYGMFPENSAFQSRSFFRPAIAFEPDDGTGGSGGGGDPTPAPATDPAPPEDVSGLKAALEAERKRAKDSDRTLKQLQESIKGIDPEKYKQFENLQKQAEEWNQEKVKIRNEVESEWVPKVQAGLDKAKAVETQYLDLLKRTTAEKAYQAANGRSGAGDDSITYFDSLLAVISPFLRLNEKQQVEVVDANGARRFSAKDATKPMSPQEFFESLHKHPVLGHCFQPTGNGNGGGMPPGSGNHRHLSTEDMSNLSRAERLTVARNQASR